MANPPKQEPAPGGFLRSLIGAGGENQEKLLAQTVVTWQDDESVTECPFCKYFHRHSDIDLDYHSTFRTENIIVDYVDESYVAIH
jgi:hypothetical protein